MRAEGVGVIKVCALAEEVRQSPSTAILRERESRADQGASRRERMFATSGAAICGAQPLPCTRMAVQRCARPSATRGLLPARSRSRNAVVGRSVRIQLRAQASASFQANAAPSKSSDEGVSPSKVRR